jgi:ion channel-forming bestrophin family protein
MITTFQRSFIKSADYAWREIAGYLVYTALISFLYKEIELHYLSIGSIPITILATAVTLLLSFRNNSAYDRWWEARNIWGSIINQSRTFSNQIISLIGENNGQSKSENALSIHKELMHRHLAYINALRLQLRDISDCQEIKGLLSQNDWEQISKAANKATQLNFLQAQTLSKAKAQGLLSEFNLILIHENLKLLYDSQGAAERIKNTPFPKIYDFGTRLVLWSFLCLLPFALLETFGYRTIFFSVVVSIVFIAVIEIGIIMQEPFQNQPNDISMSAICRNIEIDLRQMLGEASVPSPLKPENGILM